MCVCVCVCATSAHVLLFGCFGALVSASLCFASPIFAKQKELKDTLHIRIQDIHILTHTHGHAKQIYTHMYARVYAYARTQSMRIYLDVGLFDQFFISFSECLQYGTRRQACPDQSLN